MRLPLLGSLVLLFGCTAGMAQEEDRKIKTGATPEYPELARKLHIQGVARVQITVTQDGRVDKVKELGGHPVLVDALVRAVKKWRYQPAEKESVIEVKFEFLP